MAWCFNKEAFLLFKEVYILTYLFEGSLMKYYFDMNDMEYNKCTIEDFKIIPFNKKKPYDKECLKKLINLYEGKLNATGDKETALSLNWFKNKIDLRDRLKKDLYNYLHNIIKASSEEIIWTTFKAHRSQLRGKGFSNSFIALNTRATNNYKDRNTIAYCCNRYISPDYKFLFRDYQTEMNEEMYALCEMIQFIWRSSIRENKPINLYIPSSRMRNLFTDWLDNPNI
jgi:hypothetical protein